MFESKRQIYDLFNEIICLSNISLSRLNAIYIAIRLFFLKKKQLCTPEIN